MVGNWERSLFSSCQLSSVIKLASDSEDEDKATAGVELSLQPMGAPFTIHYKVDLLCVGYRCRT